MSKRIPPTMDEADTALPIKIPPKTISAREMLTKLLNRLKELKTSD